MCRKAAERRSLRLFCGKNRHFGPSDWFRTSGLVVPNHALYHLSYTRIFDFLVLPLWSKMWSNGVFGELCGSHEVPKLQCFQGFRGFRISLERRGCYTLPKQARYQLRYTRVLNYCVQGDGPGHRLYYTQGTQKKQSKVLTIQKIELKSMAVLCMIALR